MLLLVEIFALIQQDVPQDRYNAIPHNTVLESPAPESLQSKEGGADMTQSFFLREDI